MQIKYKVFQPNTFLKFDESDNGSVTGYATTFDGQPDSDGDRILAGAAGTKSFNVPMLAFHDRTRPIGSALMAPDMYGVKALGAFAKTQDAQDMRENARSGGTPAFSIGFTSEDYTPNDFGGLDFKSINIVEVSLVPIPANTGALVSAVKMHKATSEGLKKQYADIEPPEGTYEAVQEDLIEALSDLYQNDDVESVWVQLLATFPDSVVYCVSSYPEQETDGTYQVPYLRPGHDDVTLGNPKPVEVQQTIMPDDDGNSTAVSTAPAMAMESDQLIETKAADVSDKPWSDFSQADYTIEQWRHACLIGPKEESENKGDYKLPISEPDGTLNKNGVHAAAARLDQVDAPDDQKKAAAKKLLAAYKKLEEEPPESLTESAKSSRVKLIITDLAKGGRRNSTRDQNALDQAHEAIVKAGAYCAGMEEKAATTSNSSLELLAEIAELEAF